MCKKLKKRNLKFSVSKKFNLTRLFNKKNPPGTKEVVEGMPIQEERTIGSAEA
jgi:hypothetical protein